MHGYVRRTPSRSRYFLLMASIVDACGKIGGVYELIGADCSSRTRGKPRLVHISRKIESLTNNNPSSLALRHKAPCKVVLVLRGCKKLV